MGLLVCWGWVVLPLLLILCSAAKWFAPSLTFMSCSVKRITYSSMSGQTACKEQGEDVLGLLRFGEVE